MPKKPQRSFFRKLSILIIAIISVLAFVYAVVGDKGYVETKKQQEKNRDLTRKIEELSKENREILQEIKALKTDPKAIEKIAREELGMVRPGEVKITANPSVDKKNSATSQSEKPSPE
jgi:cell division protein FtsB